MDNNKTVEEAAKEYADKNWKGSFLPKDIEAAFLAGHSLANERIKELEKENSENFEECKRLAKIADFWQKKYYELESPQLPGKIDNL